jgi:hypothetical protein
MGMLQEKALERALAGTGTAVDFSGTWINELGSSVILTQKGDVLTGTYNSAVSADEHSTLGHLQGYVDGGLISFVVHWDEFQAITAWVGELDPKAAKQTINTLWQMTKKVPSGDEWASINAGADYFTRK